MFVIIRKMRILTAVLLLCSISTFAQIKGVVKDSLTGQPIPYVNISVENENIGSTSEENGSFSLPNSKTNNRIVFSSIGYFTKVISNDQAQMVFLKPKTVELNEVFIDRPKGMIEKRIENSKKGSGFHVSGKDNWINTKFFPFDSSYNETEFIKKVTLTTRSMVNGAKFKLHFFKPDSKGFPGEELTSEEVIISVRKGNRKNNLDVSKFNIKFPETGIFVGYEVLLIETNKYTFDYFDSITQKKTNIIYFAPDFEINLSDEERTFVFSGGVWHKRKRLHDQETEKLEKYNNKVLEPNISLLLSN